MDIKYFPVSSCPRNRKSWLDSSIRLNCPYDEKNRTLYQCTPNADKSTLVEFCFRGRIGRYPKDSCLYAFSESTNFGGYINSENCLSFSYGCPNETYLNNEIYKYPACLEINSEERCFLADPACPNLKSKKEYQNMGNLFFKNPVVCIEKDIKELREKNKLQYAILVICLLNKNAISGQIFDSDDEKITKLKMEVFENCRVETIPRWRLIESLEEMLGTYLRKVDEHTFVIMNDTLTEVVAFTYGSDHPRSLLNYMSSSFVTKKIRVGSVEDNGSPERHIIMKDVEFLSEKYLQYIKDGKFQDVFTSEAFLHKEFSLHFFEMLKKMKDDEMIAVFTRKSETSDSIVPTIIWNDIGDIGDDLRYENERQRQRLLFDMRTNETESYSIKAISWIVYYGHLNLLKLLIKMIGEFNCHRIFSPHLEEQTRLLVLACFNGSCKLVETVLNHIDTSCIKRTSHYIDDILDFHRSHTPLTAACENGHISVARCLLEKGVNVNDKDLWGQTPLIKAARNGHESLLQYLIKKENADLKETDKNRSLIFEAASCGHTNVIQYLVKDFEMDIEIATNLGETPLYIASWYGHLETIKYLLTKGADKDKCTKDRQFSPLYVAARGGHLEVVKLLSRNSNINECLNTFRQTALHVASWRGHQEVVKYLIRNGADINLRDYKGQTSLYLASEEGNVFVIESLKSKILNFREKTNNLVTALEITLWKKF
ncbi:putative ankyrin repeat protein RBE_0220 [Saccostrea echinata]|uniref:putative ankyrin repeat protein RBE_0220 n=1 Tax=Saccostrea echinata TaxID=191078 RepID=UPI002A829648|nr:putative ankyrin repeat protein RBE_0220 [Saccostrea echinata]